jgi:predicted unusual protein kinase regulating ubiquinone biosynthesis (AarF/ABC1/UbiB family)
MAAPRITVPSTHGRLHPLPGGGKRQAGAFADARALERRRFRVIAYFTRVALHFLWWDYFLKRSWLSAFRTPWVPRWRRLTERYKDMALDLQGLWIKLGQFLSTRVDILPIEITKELESLRDEVPAVPVDAIIGKIEASAGVPLSDLFSAFSPQPIGSASLAQVHRATTIAGEPVVVKVRRPAIREIIGTDVKLLRKQAHWLKLIKPFAQRADIDAIVKEFDTVTMNELDLRLEARNVERFALDFAGDPAFAVPRIYLDQSSESVLTMEDVSFIRIDDTAALEAAGIDRRAVAKKLYSVYLRQFFVTYRIHADPHPGNLFIRPQPTPLEIASGVTGFLPGEFVPHAEGRPFTLVIVDFGMVVEMPPRLRHSLRDFAIGLGTRDARRILDSYSQVGVVPPGADLDRVEEMIQEQLDHFWGTFIGQMNDTDLTGPAAQAFVEKYQGLMTATPFQFQTEMLFMMRAMGILSGVTSTLDPKFDAWTETAPFARKLIQDDVIEQVVKVVRTSVQDLVAGRMPSGIGPLLNLLPRQSDKKTSKTNAAAVPRPDEVLRLRASVNRLTALVVAGGVLAVGALLRSRGIQVSDVPRLLWPGNDLGQWVIELAGAAILVILVHRSGSKGR